MQETSLMKTFENTEFGNVRVVMIDNVPWFVGKDVASVLGYERVTKAIVDHVREKDPEGKSILRNAYRSWYFKKRIQEIEGIGIEATLLVFLF